MFDKWAQFAIGAAKAFLLSKPHGALDYRHQHLVSTGTIIVQIVLISEMMQKVFAI